ncbi:MAG: hypothetical protein MUC49_18025 [Raineya sp.]|jgi:hypothetical protein|nr:hypothetical protein [Raineya sp.]
MGVYACLYVFDDKILYEEVKPLLQNANYKQLLNQYIDKNLPNKTIQAETIWQSSLLLDDEFKNLQNNQNISKNVDYELLCSLFEHLIVSKCLLREPVFRISKYSLKNSFIDKAKEFDWQQNSFAFEMLKKLDGPIFWTHSSGGYHEGIRGWIDHEEAALMLEDLNNVTFNPEYQKYYEDEEKALREFLEYAVNLNKGILNGGDLHFDKK